MPLFLPEVCSFGTLGNIQYCRIAKRENRLMMSFQKSWMRKRVHHHIPSLNLRSCIKLFIKYVFPFRLHNVTSSQFQRKIRIRLHGARLGPNYTLSMRLQSSNNRFTQPEKPVRKRQRNAERKKKQETPSTSDHDDYTEALDDRVPTAHMALNSHTSTYEQEVEEQENERVRLTNAYPGATNSINSIHQRTWYLSMDRLASGFALTRDKYGTQVWVRKQEGEKLAGFEPFFVRGKEIERSIVTGRLSADIYDDDGVKGFVGRKGWGPVLE